MFSIQNSCLTVLLAAMVSVVDAREFFVAPSGSDANAGSVDAPFQTIARAQQVARTLAGHEAVTVTIADGVYYLPSKMVFTSSDSGTESAPVLYRAAHEGRVILSGGLLLNLSWQPHHEGIVKAVTPTGLQMDQLFADGVRQQMARYPNSESTKKSVPYNGYAADAISAERARRWIDPAGGYIHAMHSARWGGYHYRITGKHPDGSLVYEGGWQNNRQMGMHKEQRMVENILEELDAPGEWFHDAKTNTLYFYPPAEMNPHRVKFEGVRLASLIEFRGTQAKPVRFIAVQGLVFCHTARTFMDSKEPLLRSDWTIYRGGAVFLTGTEDCAVLDSTFDQVGANALFVSNYNRRLRFDGLHIVGAGASGIAFVGDPAAVRDPLFEYSQVNDLQGIDRIPGPKGDNYPADSVVDDCLIHGVGLVEKQAAAVQISMSQGITVRHCSIYDTSRAGINISEGTWGGHLIEFCDVFDTVLETHDHGSFNSWGRDRYWTRSHRDISQPAVQDDPRLPYLDAVSTTVVRNSRWRCDHGWDIDLDDGSSNYEIYNNLMLNGGLKFREGYGRKAYNNILLNNGFHPHVWFEESGDEFFSNIVMRRHAPIRMPSVWGTRVDSNFFFTPAADFEAHRSNGRDAHSRAGDPGFVDPTNGNFAVRNDSPAVQIGFRNFPMDNFGVRKSSLRRIAREPVIPTAAPLALAAEEVSQSIAWNGAILRDIQGNEFSTFGVTRESGGIHVVQVLAETIADASGLRANDLIQKVDGRVVRHTGEFLLVLHTASRPLALTVVRDQRLLTVVVAAE